MFGRIRNSAYLRKAAHRAVSLSPRPRVRGPVIRERKFGMSGRNGSQYDDPHVWHQWGARHNWAPTEFTNTDGYKLTGEWYQCDLCAIWLFHHPDARNPYVNVGRVGVRLSHCPQGKFFCAPCCKYIDEAGVYCATCGAVRCIPEYAEELDAGYDDDDNWYCCGCWSKYYADAADTSGEYEGEEEAEDEGEDNGEEGSWCVKCDTFFPSEYSDFGWQDFICAECTDESATPAAAPSDKEAATLSKHEKNEADVSIIADLTVVGRLGLCPFYVYWTHVRGREESCDGRCGLVHDSPGNAALGELLFADPPKLHCCSGTNPPCLEPTNLKRATGHASASDWINSLPWCALPARQRPAPPSPPTATMWLCRKGTPHIPPPPSLPLTAPAAS